jgi:hypothetical protein
MIKKIISGGQTGADRAALDTAIKLKIPHGGWIPKGRKAEDGQLPDKYELLEMPTESYPKRTEQNVIDSDGTLIICRGKPTGGSDYTREMALKHKKYILHIDLNLTTSYGAASLILSWSNLHRIEVLNVAGSRRATIQKYIVMSSESLKWPSKCIELMKENLSAKLKSVKENAQQIFQELFMMPLKGSLLNCP